MSKVRVEIPETPQAPRRRSRVGAACAVALVLLATHVDTVVLSVHHDRAAKLKEITRDMKKLVLEQVIPGH